MGQRDTYDDVGAGCRPCCSNPSGTRGIMAGIMATVSLALSLTAERACHFLQTNGFEYCTPPPDPVLAYGCCGDCYCINGDQPCPEKVPNMNISQATVDVYKGLNVTNPYNITCNPYDEFYNGIPCETTPPQDPALVALGDEAVCAVKYDDTNLDENQCPTQYSLQTYQDEASAESDGAVMTHWGACGVCSTLQDLSVYIENPDLTNLGSQCSFAMILGEFEDGIRCYQRAGYTRPCATMWLYNALQTADYCVDTCLGFRIQQRPNNSPPPECILDNCLHCDETHSGPLFAKVAARSRRRSGLISKIVRECDQILFVNHLDPCKVVAGTPETFSQDNVCFETYIPDYTPSCIVFRGNLGLTSFEDQTSNDLFGIQTDDGIYRTFYGTCTAYDTNRVKSGFWQVVSNEILGGPWKAAKAFATISSIVGIVCWIFIWIAACVAFPKAFWLTMFGLYLLCTLCDWLTFVFFASPACGNGGCKMMYAGYVAIFSGLAFLITACICWSIASKNIAMRYTPVVQDVTINEYVNDEGTTFKEKIVTQSNGTKTVERTVYTHKDKADAPVEADTAVEPAKGEEAEESPEIAEASSSETT